MTTTQSTHPNPQKHHQKKINILQWPSQSPDLNPIDHLWGDLKRAVHRRCLCNLTDLEHFCKEEWANIATSRCAMLRGDWSLEAGGAQHVVNRKNCNKNNVIFISRRLLTLV
uniref:Tc1-like transposase DDE domain-containing protein n=1 Tax=Esox lucius TaxID=8010 RepID=A0AAY5JZL0_ESOLU